ncbi:hypothetical protein TanjilG_17107 [Lupinus angustifolius]|uniref:GDSL esterase/lipase n=1 Tax=Lupinus angustifolius TaxID=3871 RepID=A0A4P1R0K7_LUPAN|nr:hypothetical protein TanjilG_17107 [Lupinus angustifolius]
MCLYLKDKWAEKLGFTSYQPAYLNLEVKGKNLLNGANFASAASGFFDFIPQMYRLYAMGARKIGVTNAAPMGCLPVLITLFGSHSNECVDRLNNDSIDYNKKLNKTSQNLRKILPGIKLVVCDIYQPLYNLVTNPSQNGFSETRRGCCGTGLLETAIICNNMSTGTCANASNYVFWDGAHPSEATNKILADVMVDAGIPLLMS